MECAVRGVLPGEICLTSSITGHSICLVAADISRVKQMPDGTTKLTFKRGRKGVGNLYRESVAEVNNRIAKVMTE